MTVKLKLYKNEGSQPPAGDHLAAANVMVATPAYGGLVNIKTASLMMQMATSRTRPAGLDWVCLGNESHILRARNTLLSLFVHNLQYTHLFFLDADVSCGYHIVNRLLSYGKDVIGGMVPMKGKGPDGGPAYAVGRIVGEAGADLANVEWIGNACLMLSRKAVNDYIELFKPSQYMGNPSSMPPEIVQYDFFGHGITEDGYYESEDQFVCRRFREIGYEIFVYHKEPLTHTGTGDF